MPPKCAKAIWTPQTTEEYLHLLVDFCSQNVGQVPPKSTHYQWIGVLGAKFGQFYTLDQMRSKYQRFKKDYLDTTAIRNDSGLGWDDIKQIVTCFEERWENYHKGDENIKRLKNGLPNYELYHAIFRSSFATGMYLVPSTYLYLRQHDVSDDDEFDDADVDASTIDTAVHSRENRSSTSRGGKRNKKKGKMREEYESSLEKIAFAFVAKCEKAMSSEQSRQTDPQTDLMSEVINIITGLEELDDIQICQGIEFFKTHPDAQRVFLDLPLRFRTTYIRTVLS